MTTKAATQAITWIPLYEALKLVIAAYAGAVDIAKQDIARWLAKGIVHARGRLRGASTVEPIDPAFFRIFKQEDWIEVVGDASPFMIGDIYITGFLGTIIGKIVWEENTVLPVGSRHGPHAFAVEVAREHIPVQLPSPAAPAADTAERWLENEIKRRQATGEPLPKKITPLATVLRDHRKATAGPGEKVWSTSHIKNALRGTGLHPLK